ncbi:hypothetical protein [Sphingomonas sp. PP-CC-3G-468]|uniref:hypothetical protein n=1 Tax=Sphingomonas sp. PP-CC-3G-468 TaxID=2135656 RepID=UPI001050D8CA|nr:hypothetical protein [Sphingomonas sp. PP-CC-3G-468]TCM07462.1 hypothetical protein C8J41_103370 [Sphingomonas sp. PP-CC-3G-468]
MYSAVERTADAILQDFADFTEDMLADSGGLKHSEVARGSAVVVDRGTAVDTLLDAARLLRALEQVAMEGQRYLEGDRCDDLEDAWSTSDGNWYVVPRLKALAPIEGKPFLRRALLAHRVLPTTIQGHYRVRMHRLPSVTDTRSAKTYDGRFGAALFPGLDVDLSYPVEGRFLVDRLSGFDPGTLLKEQIADARTAGCTALVWAELTMPKSHVEEVRSILSQTALDGDVPFSFVMPGSWHTRVHGQMRNVGEVLNGRGEPLFPVVKWAKFTFDGLREDIVPGDEIPVLVGDDSLTTFAICRDFLQETGDIPYKKLNVDLAIVPSMTSNNDELDTLVGHAATANTLRVRYGTRTLVVAQPARSGKAGDGRVLAFPKKPLLAAGGIVVTGPSSVWDLESP